MKKSYLFAAAAIIMWSTMSTVSKLLLDKLDSFTVLCMGSLCATITMIFIVLLSGKFRTALSYKPLDYLKMALVGLPGVFLYYVFYYSGANVLPASQAFITNYLWPVMSIVFAVPILHERMTLRKVLAITLSFIGVFTVAGNDILSFSLTGILGTLSCLTGAVCYGLFTALNKRSPYDKQITMTVAMGTSFVLSLVIMLVRGAELPTLSQIPGIAWSGIFTMAIANLCWSLALGYGNTARISNLAYITPFLSLVWNFFILENIPSSFSIVGLCLIIGGIFIQLRGNDKKKEA